MPRQREAVLAYAKTPRPKVIQEFYDAAVIPAALFDDRPRPMHEPASRDWCPGVSYKPQPTADHWPVQQVRLGRCPKPRHGPSPWTSILMRVFDGVLSRAWLSLEHGVPFNTRGTSDASFNDRPPRQHAAAAHDRRHVNARLTTRYTTRVYSFCAQLRSLPEERTRYGNVSDNAPKQSFNSTVSAASGGMECAVQAPVTLTELRLVEPPAAACLSIDWDRDVIHSCS
jgi:hypothetical protein